MVKSIFNSEQIDFIKNNYSNVTYQQMSDMELFNGLDSKQIRSKARALGLSKTRKFNSDYFNLIDTENKAYWLGFIYADGYIVYNKNNRNYETGIEIHTNDKYMLDKLNQELGNQHKITSRKRNIEFNGYEYISSCSRLRIYSKDICDALIEHGVDINKTNSSIYPKVQHNLFMHFLRGFLDGDGCIYAPEDKLKAIHFTNANKEFLEYIQQQLLSINIDSNIHKEKDKKYRLYISMKQAKEFLDKIYEDCSIKLERKYQIYNSL